jgi:hypothetical protein
VPARAANRGRRRIIGDVRWLALVLLALGVTAAAHATGPPGVPVLPVTTSAPQQQPAPGTTVSLTGVPLRCGMPFGSLAIAFPAAARLPRTIAPDLVTLNGTTATRVAVARGTIRITLLPKGITCHSISVGPLQIHFAPAARVRLQGRRSAVATVRYGTRTFRARVTVVVA